MPKDIDEDLIEATIRRVAESKAARDTGPDDDEVERTLRRVAESRTALSNVARVEAEIDAPGDAPADEDLIEATIRRVAEEKAARDTGPDDDLIERTMRSVSQSRAALARATPEEADIGAPEGTPAGDLIEATIRRVAEEKAARDAAPAIEMPVAEAIAPEIRRLDESTAATPQIDEEVPPALADVADANADDEDDEPAPQLAPFRLASRTAARTAPVPPTSITAAPAADDIAGQLRLIGQRLDFIVALLEGISLTPRASSSSSEWDDEPDVVRIPSGMPLRPAILRDPSPRAATAEHLEPDVIDTRPIPKPLPPIHVEPKRGFDLLPRNYRITVEDKRRGVDLVPLHRALLSMDGVRDMSLLSYNNGIAIVALETTNELEPDALGESVGKAMSRPARVEVHNEHTMVVKLAEE